MRSSLPFSRNYDIDRVPVTPNGEIRHAPYQVTCGRRYSRKCGNKSDNSERNKSADAPSRVNSVMP